MPTDPLTTMNILPPRVNFITLTNTKMFFLLKRLFKSRYKNVCVCLVSFCDKSKKSERHPFHWSTIFIFVFLLLLVLGFLRPKLADLPFLPETPQCLACMKNAPFKSWPKGACNRYYCYECPEELISSTSDEISHEPPQVRNDERPLLLAWEIESGDLPVEVEGNPVEGENPADPPSTRTTMRDNIQCGHEVCPGCQQEAQQGDHVDKAAQNSKWEKPGKDCTQCGGPVTRCKNMRCHKCGFEFCYSCGEKWKACQHKI